MLAFQKLERYEQIEFVLIVFVFFLLQFNKDQMDFVKQEETNKTMLIIFGHGFHK